MLRIYCARATHVHAMECHSITQHITCFFSPKQKLQRTRKEGRGGEIEEGIENREPKAIIIVVEWIKNDGWLWWNVKLFEVDSKNKKKKRKKAHTIHSASFLVIPFGYRETILIRYGMDRRFFCILNFTFN